MKKIRSIFSSSKPKSLDTKSLDKLLFENLKWQFALESSNIGIWDFDADLNRVTFSKESKNIIGFIGNDFGANPNDWNNRIHPEDKEKYFQDFQDHLNGLTPIYKNISRIQCKDGTYKWILDKGKIIEYTNNGKAKRIIGVHIDITESKGKEENLAKQIDLITKQNNKLKNFAHIATHNLKEHAGNFESLLSFYDEAETIEEKNDLINHIKTVSKSLKKTINNLREIVTVDSNKSNQVESLNLSRFIDNAIINSEIEIDNTFAKVINNIDEEIYLKFNSAYLESIIQNLLTNSLKYRDPERDPIISFEANKTSDGLSFSITDNGLGIDLEKHGNDFFGLYRTFHKNKNSEGVGLYLTKNQVEAFDGTIAVKSTVGIGTRLTITLPKTKNPA
jgi:PAS domain S-box-containing protein